MATDNLSSLAYQTSHPIGAYDTVTMVGRHQQLERVLEVLRRKDDQPAVVFLTGEGGIGKTRFLRELLQRAGDEKNVVAVADLIDLYHVENHIPDGLSKAIWQALPSIRRYFWDYERELERYDRMLLAGDMRQSHEQHRRTLEAFVQALQKSAATHRLFIVLDTAERAIYSSRGLTGRPAEHEVAESWHWLANVLPTLKNTVLVIAGRPPASNLGTFLTEPSVLKLDEKLANFTPDESIAYFAALADAAHKQNDHGTARRIEALDETVLRALHRYAGGLPIYLALFVDFLNVAGPGDIPDELRQPTEEPGAHPAELRRQLEERLVDRLVLRSGLGDTLRAIGRAPKGVDSQLLAQLRNISVEEAEDELQQARGLSFVKTRPSDQRVFLHDVMYEMFERQVFGHLHDAPQAGTAASEIKGYYEGRLGRVHKKMRDLLQPVLDGQATSLNLSEIAKMTLERQSLLAELAYYELRVNPLAGFRRYYRYAHETIFSGQTLLDLLLQTELVTFWSERDPAWQTEQRDGLSRALVEAVIAIRPIARAWAEGDYAGAVRLAETIRTEYPRLFEGGQIAGAILGTWEAMSKTYLGTPEQLEQAGHSLDEGISLLQDTLRQSSSEMDAGSRWLAKAVLASAARSRGYLHRTQGRLGRSISDYRIAAHQGREVNVQTELARTLNDLGFALAEQGQWADARSLVKEALEIQLRFGLFALAALSINTLALISVRAGEYESALERSDAALRIFRALQFERGVGLALTAKAEASRRRADSSTSWSLDRKLRNLRDSREWAREAVGIFEKEQERLRQVEALIEVGCACRNWVHLLREQRPDDSGTAVELYSEGDNALRGAAQLAGDAYLYRKVDALVDLAWLQYYAGEIEALRETVSQAEAAVPSQYRFAPESGHPSIEKSEAIALLWPQLGKLQILQGAQRFREYLLEGEKGRGNPEALEQSGRFFTLGLEYSRQYAAAYQGMDRAKETVNRYRQQLSPEELSTLAEAVSKTEEEFHFISEDGTPSSEMRRFLESRAVWYGDDA